MQVSHWVTFVTLLPNHWIWSKHKSLISISFGDTYMGTKTVRKAKERYKQNSGK